MKISLNEEEQVMRIAVKLIPSVGDTVARNLFGYCGSAKAIFTEKKSRLMKIPGVGPATAEHIVAFKNFRRAEEEWRFIEKHKIQLCFYADDHYPKRLKQIIDPPFILYYRGSSSLDQPKIIGVVGTRQATEYGKKFCSQLIEALVPFNVLVISGLAYGIDIAAHRAALRNNLPTIAVLAHGLDRIYPSAHKNIASKMIGNGGVLSEYISGTPPDREHFPERNRIVAAMSDAIIVVEAAEKGGALITAEYANSYNKDVFALPGRNNDEYSAGCNKLIKTHKAALIENADDLIYIMGWDTGQKSKKMKQISLNIDLSPLELQIIRAIEEKGKTHIDELTIIASTPNSELALILLNLEFNGILKSHPGNYYTRS